MKDAKVIYDIQSCPEFVDMRDIVQISKDSKFVIWDSSISKFEPKIVNDADLKVVDSTTEEGQKILEKFKNDK